MTHQQRMDRTGNKDKRSLTVDLNNVRIDGDLDRWTPSCGIRLWHGQTPFGIGNAHSLETAVLWKQKMYRPQTE